MLPFYSVLLAFAFTAVFLFVNTITITLSFIMLMNVMVILTGFYLSVRKTTVTLDLVYWIFNYFFFIIAPVIQVQGLFFPNSFPIYTNQVIYGQILIFVWNFIYLLLRKNYSSDFSLNYSEKNLKVGNFVRTLYFTLATGIVLYIFLTKGGVYYFYGHASIHGPEQTKAAGLLINATIGGIVFSNFIFQFMKRKEGGIITFILIAISFLELFYVNSPFNTTRYYQGFLILFFIWFFYRKSISPMLFSFILLFGVIFVFSFLDVFMKAGFTTEIDFNLGNSFSQFNQLHFDAFSSLLVTIEYTNIYDYLLGLNLIGSMLFFVPRAIWPAKPVDSGTRVGEYLMDNYGFHFSNLSNPFISEFYLSFGVIGIVMGAALLALIVNHLERNLHKNMFITLLYGILLSYLFIILRGSLMVAISSVTGTVFFLVILPWLINKFESNLSSTAIKNTVEKPLEQKRLQRRLDHT